MIAQRPQQAAILAERHPARCERERLAQVHQRHPELMAWKRTLQHVVTVDRELMTERLSRAEERDNRLRAAVKRLADGQQRAETIPSNGSVNWHQYRSRYGTVRCNILRSNGNRRPSVRR